MHLLRTDYRKGEEMELNRRRTVCAVLAAVATLPATGCAPLLVGGAVAGTAMVAADRRSTGIQVEDQEIEVRVAKALSDKFPGDKANISVTSYNTRVLLTGEVATEQVKSEAQAIAEKSQNVAAVLNELYVGSLSTLSNRNFDTSLTTKVRAALATADGVPSGTIKVVTSRSVVYLMGLVTRFEGDAAARVASRVAGVQKVVKCFEYLPDRATTMPAPEPASDAKPK
jgi:osmotically-inducible protein OsmY